MRLEAMRYRELLHRLVLSEQSESNGFLDSAVGLARNDIGIFFVEEGRSCRLAIDIAIGIAVEWPDRNATRR